MTGATEHCHIFLDLGGVAAIADLLAVDSGGNTMANSVLEITSTTAATMPAAFSAASGANQLKIGSAFKGSFTATLNGVTGAVTATGTWAQVGNVVTLNIPALIGISNSTSASITGLPADVWPATNQYPQMLTIDNSITGPGRALITPAGAFILNKLDSSGFTAVNNKGLPDVTFSYQKF